MVAMVALLIAVATLAFGAVYPWAYLPLFCAAALIGAVGIVRNRNSLRELRTLAALLLLMALIIGGQLIPLSRSILDALSPDAAKLLSRYSLTFDSAVRHTLSITPTATLLAVGAFGSFGLYLVGLAVTLSDRSLRSLPWHLIAFATPLALFGIASREWSNGLVYWLWKPHDGGGSNAFGPFVNRNHFAGWMLMALCLTIGSLLGQIDRAGRRGESRQPRLRSWALSSRASELVLTIMGTLTMGVALMWTMSRSAILAFVVALGCFLVLLGRRQQLSGVLRAGAGAALALVLVAGVSWRGTSLLVRWFGDTRDLESRLAAWRDGWRVFQDFPLTGTGLNTYGTAMLFYQNSNPGFHLGSAHNDYLQLIAEGGLLVAIPAALTIVVLVGLIRRNLLAARHESRGYWIRAGAAVGLVAIAVQEAAEFSLQIPANAFLCATLAAIALAPVDGAPASQTTTAGSGAAA